MKSIKTTFSYKCRTNDTPAQIQTNQLKLEEIGADRFVLGFYLGLDGKVHGARFFSQLKSVKGCNCHLFPRQFPPGNSFICETYTPFTPTLKHV